MAVMSATRRGKHQLLGQIGSPVQVKYGAGGKKQKTNKSTNTKCSKSNSGRFAAARAEYGAEEARDRDKYTKTKTNT